MKKTYLPYNFRKNQVEFFLIYKLNLASKFKNSLNYIFQKLPNQELKDFNDLNWHETKSYEWAVIVKDNVKMLVRKFNRHFTFFVKCKIKFKDEGEQDDYITETFFTKYCCFTYFSDVAKLSNYVEDYFIDINNDIEKIVDMIAIDEGSSLWNSAALPRSEHIEIKNIWNGGEFIESIDKFIFALEELDNLHLKIFSENETFAHLKQYNVGDKMGKYVVTDVATTLVDDYYHGVGLEVEDNGKEKFIDVYSLTRWYWEDFFNIKKDNFDGLFLDGENIE